MRDVAVTVHGVKETDESLQFAAPFSAFLARGKIVFSNIYAVVNRAISPGMVRCGRDIFVFLTLLCHTDCNHVPRSRWHGGGRVRRWFLYI